MSAAELVQTVNELIRGFQDPIFTAFCIMLAFSLALGFKRIVLE